MYEKFLLLCHSSLNDEAKSELLATVIQCHEGSAVSNRSNLSNVVVLEAGFGSLDFGNSVIAGLASLGGLHAPIAGARRALYGLSFGELEQCIKTGEIVPGWGNSFFKDDIDPSWKCFDVLLKQKYPIESEKLERRTRLFWEHGRKVYPNAASYSAIACELLGINKGLEVLPFILGRLAVWAELFDEHCTGKIK